MSLEQDTDPLLPPDPNQSEHSAITPSQKNELDYSVLNQIGSKIKQSLMVKVMSTLFLLMLSMIPIFFIQELIAEREKLQRNTISDINQKWAGQQTVTGPVLTLPYKKVEVIETKHYKEDKLGNPIGEPIKKKKTVTSRHYLHVLPASLKIDGKMSPKMLHRGIYHMVVYRSDLNIKGHFEPEQFENLPVKMEHIYWDKAYLSMGLNDLRGIEETIELKWGEHKGKFDPGTRNDQLYTSGVNHILSMKPKDIKKNIPFEFNLKLKGNQRLFFAPVGKETQVTLKSPWDNPSFDGQFLPDERKITEKDFVAHWKILHLNRNFPQIWQDKKYQLNDYAFGVRLIQPVDHYHKTERSVKYALFFVGLTFMTFFFVEVLTKRFVHPLQYLLIGFALCVFYTLLLSISEHLNFDLAYVIASGMTIALITSYSAGILKSISLTGITSGVLICLYGFIYTIIQQQDYALLMGSFGIFIVLALVMFFSRKIDFESTSI